MVRTWTSLYPDFDVYFGRWRSSLAGSDRSASVYNLARCWWVRSTFRVLWPERQLACLPQQSPRGRSSNYLSCRATWRHKACASTIFSTIATSDTFLPIAQEAGLTGIVYEMKTNLNDTGRNVLDAVWGPRSWDRDFIIRVEVAARGQCPAESAGLNWFSEPKSR